MKEVKDSTLIDATLQHFCRRSATDIEILNELMGGKITKLKVRYNQEGVVSSIDIWEQSEQIAGSQYELLKEQQ